MAYQRLEVLTGTERRRLWSDAEKVHLIEAVFRPGIVVKEVARRFGVHESLLYRWRRQLGVSVPAFSPVQLAPVDEPMAVPVAETAMPASSPGGPPAPPATARQRRGPVPTNHPFTSWGGLASPAALR